MHDLEQFDESVTSNYLVVFCIPRVNIEHSLFCYRPLSIVETKAYTSILLHPVHHLYKFNALGLPAHAMVFIFFTFLRGVFKSSVLNSFKNTIFIVNKCGY